MEEHIRREVGEELEYDGLGYPDIVPVDFDELIEHAVRNSGIPDEHIELVTKALKRELKDVLPLKFQGGSDAKTDRPEDSSDPTGDTDT